jgi:DNA-binding LacI/PurR family transcriptional regulator
MVYNNGIVETKAFSYTNGISLYVQLKEALARDFVSDVTEGDKLFTFKEIADRYGVSVVTVAKAVEKLKQEGVIYSIPGRGIYLKDRDRLLKLYGITDVKIHTIGVTFTDIYSRNSNFQSSAYLSELIRTLSRESRRFNFNLQIFATPSADLNAEDNPLLWENLRKKNIDGLILASRMPVKNVALLQEEGIPFVWISNDIPYEDICSVLPNQFDLNLAIFHLSRLRHKKIALLTTEEKTYEYKQLFKIFCANHNVEGIYCFSPGSELEEGQILTREVLAAKDRPDALITIGLDLTASAAHCAYEQGLSIPGDIALIGLTGSYSSDFFLRNVSFLYIPMPEMVRNALEMLQGILNGERVQERKRIVNEQLVVRGSCGYPVGEKKEIVISDIKELESLVYP